MTRIEPSAIDRFQSVCRRYAETCVESSAGGVAALILDAQRRPDVSDREDLEEAFDACIHLEPLPFLFLEAS
jgi:hypothetical protein